jgi:hypothetical protein
MVERLVEIGRDDILLELREGDLLNWRLVPAFHLVRVHLGSPRLGSLVFEMLVTIHIKKFKMDQKQPEKVKTDQSRMEMIVSVYHLRRKP